MSNKKGHDMEREFTEDGRWFSHDQTTFGITVEFDEKKQAASFLTYTKKGNWILGRRLVTEEIAVQLITAALKSETSVDRDELEEFGKLPEPLRTSLLNSIFPPDKEL